MNREKFERYCRSVQMVPLEKRETPQGNILVAEGFFTDRKDEYPWGYFKMFGALERDGVDSVDWCECEAFHDSDMTPRGKQDARVNAIVERVLMTVDDNMESGRYGR